MKRTLLLLAVICVAVSTMSCKDDKEDNPFEDTSWVNTDFVEGVEITLKFQDLTCTLSAPMGIIEFGGNYIYTHSKSTASISPLGETEVNFTAKISGSKLTLVNVTNNVTIIFDKV